MIEIAAYGKNVLPLGGIMRRFIYGVVALALGGCAQVQNVTTADVRTPEHLLETKTLPMTIPQIGSAIFQNRLVCRGIPPLEVDPLNGNHAFLSSEEPGWTRASVTTLIEFTQSGSHTKVDVYAFSSGRKVWTDRWMHAIQDPSSCD